MTNYQAKKLQEITDKIVKEYKPEKIILFGSCAWGKPGPDSDVDLLVIKKSVKRRIERERELRRKLFGNKFPPMDILVYTPEEVEITVNQNKNLFIEDIIRNGKNIYSRTKEKIYITANRPLSVL